MVNYNITAAGWRQIWGVTDANVKRALIHFTYLNPISHNNTLDIPEPRAPKGRQRVFRYRVKRDKNPGPTCSW